MPDSKFHVIHQRLMLALTLMLLIGCTKYVDPPTTNPVRVTDTAQFGRLISNETFSGLVVVFATWCPPCRHELPEVAEVYRAQAPGTARIISVSIDERDTKTVQRFVNRYQLPFPVYHAGPDFVSAYGIVGVPTLLVVNKGRIVESSPGQQSARSLAAKLEGLP